MFVNCEEVRLCGVLLFSSTSFLLPALLITGRAARCGRWHRALFPPLCNGSRTIAKVAEAWQAFLDENLIVISSDTAFDATGSARSRINLGRNRFLPLVLRTNQTSSYRFGLLPVLACLQYSNVAHRNRWRQPPIDAPSHRTSSTRVPIRSE